eukprot:m.113759 g.113759  ORF g.113759 m.113759 type:complete len:343 (+) comp51875_c0_seq1:76-1104(+)
MPVAARDEQTLRRINDEREEAVGLGQHLHRNRVDAREQHIVDVQVCGVDVESVPLLLEPLHRGSVSLWKNLGSNARHPEPAGSSHNNAIALLELFGQWHWSSRCAFSVGELGAGPLVVFTHRRAFFWTLGPNQLLFARRLGKLDADFHLELAGSVGRLCFRKLGAHRELAVLHEAAAGLVVESRCVLHGQLGGSLSVLDELALAAHLDLVRNQEGAGAVAENFFWVHELQVDRERVLAMREGNDAEHSVVSGVLALLTADCAGNRALQAGEEPGKLQHDSVLGWRRATTAARIATPRRDGPQRRSEGRGGVRPQVCVRHHAEMASGGQDDSAMVQANGWCGK